jgi:signal transduction histidine kinase
MAATPSVSQPLRRRVRLSILAATAGALVVFTLPLAVAIRSAYVQQAETELEGEAARVLVLVSDDQLLHTRTLPAPRDAEVDLSVYDSAGHLISGSGPSRSPAAVEAAASGSTVTLREGDSFAGYLPTSDDAKARAVVRAALDSSAVSGRYRRAWVLMGVLALLVLALAWFAAGRLARRLSRPLEMLADSAQALGQGGFGLHVPRSGVTEVDVVGSVLEESGRRLGDRFQRERAFSADASHQLRTPLTALRLTLEAASTDPSTNGPAVAFEALAQVGRLQQTIEDLLALARDLPDPVVPVDVSPVLASVEPRYRQLLADQGRRLEVDPGDGLPAADFPEAALRQVLDVLVDNACVHGAGTVVVSARASGTGIVVEVRDHGTLPAGDLERIFRRRSAQAQGTGIGLALARSLAEADGARLLVSRGDGVTTFTLLMAEWQLLGAPAPVRA